jgi:hypothetical protein
MKSVEIIGVLLYNFAIVAGTTYVVINYNWSMWTYLLAILFMMSVKDEQKN